MEDELLDNGEPIGASKPAPKKRGRKPKIMFSPLEAHLRKKWGID